MSPPVQRATLLELWKKQDHWKETVASKLRGFWDSRQLDNLNRCGREKIYRTCRNCNDLKTFEYHCDLKWCPRCQWRITTRRTATLRRWASTIPQPKHLVTTQRNFHTLTRASLKRHRQALAKLRRTPVFKQVKGGCVSVEITNEQRGWHLHSHWLVDARWVDAGLLATTWGNIIGQDEGAIVKVKDLRSGSNDYVAEVSKYVCKGSDIAMWKPEEILEFVQALQGNRFFFRFGTLFHMKLKHEPQDPRYCECGEHSFIFLSEHDQTLADIRHDNRRHRRR